MVLITTIITIKATYLEWSKDRHNKVEIFEKSLADAAKNTQRSTNQLPLTQHHTKTELSNIL